MMPSAWAWERGFSRLVDVGGDVGISSVNFFL